MFGSFHNRVQAGALLAARLVDQFASPVDARKCLVLGLPRGGVPVASEVAGRLGAQLDVLVVRKLGAPGNRELALGAIASGGMRVLNDDVIEALEIGPRQIAQVEAEEALILARRERDFRDDRPFPDLHGRTVIVVDDGIATGATMRAAVQAVRSRSPERVIAAAPVGSREACQALKRVADQVVCLLVPEMLLAIGTWYDDFTQVSDAEVRALLGLNDVRAHSQPAAA